MASESRRVEKYLTRKIFQKPEAQQEEEVNSLKYYSVGSILFFSLRL